MDACRFLISVDGTDPDKRAGEARGYGPAKVLLPVRVQGLQHACQNLRALEPATFWNRPTFLTVAPSGGTIIMWCIVTVYL